MFSTVFSIYRNVLLLVVVLKVFITNVNIEKMELALEVGVHEMEFEGDSKLIIKTLCNNDSCMVVYDSFHWLMLIFICLT